MANKNIKTVFTADELRQIIALVREKEIADESRQKTIRAKLRRLGLHWREVGNGEYSVDNLRLLFETGVLSLDESTLENGSAQAAVDMPQAAMELSAVKTKTEMPIKVNGRPSSRENSDEHYVINLCDEILKSKASRQHRFDFLKGDTGHLLPVDAYYSDRKLVIEYYEIQHTQDVPFFDNKKTASGVSRGEQRRIYDERRQKLLPENGIELVIISYSDFGTSKKINRDKTRDLEIVKKILTQHDVLI